MKRLHRRGCVLGLFAAAVCCGCTTVPSKGIPAERQSDLYEKTGDFVILDKELVKQLYVVESSRDRTPDGRLIVRVKVLNKSPKLLRVQMQTVFKDERGEPTGDQTNWELILIPSNAYDYYEAKAMNGRAQDAVTRCRLAK
jgi:hypothetical protein